MSDSDNARRGRFYRSGVAQFLRTHYNRVDRRRARDDVREIQGFLDVVEHEDVDPLNTQPRHRALWDAF